MSDLESCRKRAVVVQPGEGESYWQPVPACGFVEVAVADRGDGAAGFDAGIQEVAPGGHVRLHAHSAHDELILVLAGRGTARVDGEAVLRAARRIIDLDAYTLALIRP